MRAPTWCLWLLQISNRIGCYRSSAVLAGLLNRTLIVHLNPGHVDGGYDRRIVLDVDHFRKCWGANTIISSAEYGKKYGQKINIDAVKCWGRPNGPQLGCPVRDNTDAVASFFEKMTDVHVEPSLQVQWAGFESREVSPGEFLQQYGKLEARVLVTGDGFLTVVEDPLIQGGDIPFFRDQSCPTALAIRPPPAVLQAADALIASIPELADKSFISAHLRRGEDFVHLYGKLEKHSCNHCFFPIRQVADYVSKQIRQSGIRSVFISTDASSSDVRSLAS